MRQRVSGVGGDRADPVFGDHRRQQFGAASERRVPADLLPLPIHFDHRRADPVRVFVDGTQGHTLGAQVAAAPDVIGVSPDARYAAISDLNLQAAHGFTQGTGVEVAAVLTGYRWAGRLYSHVADGRSPQAPPPRITESAGPAPQASVRVVHRDTEGVEPHRQGVVLTDQHDELDQLSVIQVARQPLPGLIGHRAGSQ